MEITLVDAESQSTLIEFSGSLAAEEADDLARGAYRRLAAILGVNEDAARERARSMLTPMELRVFVEETVKMRAADRAIRTLGSGFLLDPSVRTAGGYQEGAPFSFEATLHAVPPMELDLETPIALNQTASAESDKGTPEHSTSANETDQSAPTASKVEKRMLRALRARLKGTIPATLERDAVTHESNEFSKELDRNGETYREYRIRTGKKPQEVENHLRRKALRKLYDDIAVETIFRTQGLSTAPADEEAILHTMAPGRESALLEELDHAGKLWMVAKAARRAKSIDWAVTHLLDERPTRF